jgi:hypothetical protein
MADTNARRRWFGAVVALVMGLAVLPWGVAARRAGPVEVLQFNIDYLAGDTVASDGRTSSPGWQYEDYRVPTSTDACVSAARGSGSLGFISFNRPMDTPPCESNPQPAGPTAPSRQWVIAVADGASCAILAAYDSRYVSPAPYINGPCTLTGSDLSRIRIDNLFAAKLPSTSAVDFLLKSFLGGVGYEIRSVAKAQILGAGDVRIVSYEGTARLWEVTPKYKAIAVEFPMRVHITLQRTRM